VAAEIRRLPVCHRWKFVAFFAAVLIGLACHVSAPAARADAFAVALSGADAPTIVGSNVLIYNPTTGQFTTPSITFAFDSVDYTLNLASTPDANSPPTSDTIVWNTGGVQNFHLFDSTTGDQLYVNTTTEPLSMVNGPATLTPIGILSSGGNVTGLNGLIIGGTTYNVTFGTTDNMTFAGSAANALTAEEDLSAALSQPGPYNTAGGACDVGVDGGTNTYVAFSNGGICDAPPATTTWGTTTDSSAFFGNNVGGTALWADFSPVPEPDTLTLSLTGVGLLGLMAVLRKRKAALPQAD
jgi:hypothetical protein